MKLSAAPLALVAFLAALENASAASLHRNDALKTRAFTVGQGVKTSSGTVIGKAASVNTDVSVYLGIPYAQPPVGDLRFAAPQPYTGNGTVNATAFSPDCPANAGSRGSSTNTSGLAGPNALQLLAELEQFGDTFSEDCLTLNIWTKPQTGESAKAVLFWIYGGGFETGNTNNPNYDGQYFADDQDVIIVSANYRLNVFGFPGLPGMDQNLGLLDQRLAVEWVRDNIAAFGGDPSRITIFGQSAGAASVDYYSYAWVDDPIVAGFIPESGTVTSFNNPVPSNNTAAWFNVTENLGCGGASAGIAATVACARTKTFQDILNAIPVQEGLASVLGEFGPTVDNKTVFSNYTELAAAGDFIKKPYFTGNNDYEAGLFKILAPGISDLGWAIFNLVTFTCPEADAAAARVAQGVPTWRYRYFGDFPNLRLTIDPDSGAYHGAEIPIVWETAPQVSGEANTPAETSISALLHGAWAAFAKSPDMGLSSAPYNWPNYSPLGDTLIRLAYNNETQASFVFPVTYDIACPTLEALIATIPGGLTGLLGGTANASELAPLGAFANLTQLGGGSEIGYKKKRSALYT